MSSGELLTRITAWLALLLYVIAELGRGRMKTGSTLSGRWRWVWTLGCLVYVVHVVAAFGVYHDWSHASAEAHTAQQTEAIVGWDWGGGIFVNYAFSVLWIGETLWWWMKPEGYLNRPAGVSITMRIIFLFFIGNAAVVFVSGSMRYVGICLVMALIYSLVKSIRR